VDRCPSNLPIDGPSFRRVEVLCGTPRRRRWSVEEKAAIVAESLAPGAVGRSVALRHGVHANQLYAWRRELAAAGDAAKDDAGPAFAPVAVASESIEAGNSSGVVEIAIGAAVIRVSPGVDMRFLRSVLRAVGSG
jgi:transposase